MSQLQASFMSRYGEANATRDEGLKKLEASYLGALNRHMDKVKASGKLTLVIPVRDEIAAVEAGKNPLPELPEQAGRELKDFREKYVAAREKILETHAQAVIGLADKMDEALKAAEVSLTKAGKIDEALAAKRMRETLAEDAGIKGVRGFAAPKAQFAGKEWTSLKRLKLAIREKGQFPVGWAEGDPEARLADIVSKGIKQHASDAKEVLVSVPPARLEFVAESSFTEFKCRMLMAMNGDARFSVYADGKRVKAVDLAGAGSHEDIHSRFAPATVLTLEVTDNGSPNSDWAVWLDPEFR